MVAYCLSYIVHDHRHEMATATNAAYGVRGEVPISTNAAYGMIKQEADDDYEVVDGPQTETGEYEVPSFPPYDQNVGDEMYEPIPGQ